MDSRVTATGPVGQAPAVVWPVRSGAVPSLAHGFSARPEPPPALGSGLVPGAGVALVAGQNAPAGSPDWAGTCGKTQLAAFFTESLWRSRGIDLLLWGSATSRAALLSASASPPAAVSGDHRVPAPPVRAFRPGEALSYLMGRLSAAPDQRIGAIDLVA